MKRTTILLNENDFKWVSMTPKAMKNVADEYLLHKKTTYKAIKAIKGEERTFVNTLWAIERCDEKYQSVFSKMGLLYEVSPKKDIRDAAHEISTYVSEKLVDIEYDKGMYMALVEYYEGNYSKEKKTLRKEDIKLLEETLREYRRMGFDLPDEKQKKLKTLLKKVTKLSTAFRKNINDYQDYILCTEEELEGMSDRFKALLPKHPDGRYIVSLQYPHLYPFLAEAKNGEKRKELANKNLAKGGKKNLKVLEELVSLRRDISKLLGYAHYADFRTENRMAKTGDAVKKFQDSIFDKLKKRTKEEIGELRVHAKTLGIKKMEHYDVSFVATSLKKSLFDIDPETVRAYFPLEHVREEMFSTFGNLFGFRVEKMEAKLWHKDVELFTIIDQEEGNVGAVIGYFAMDMYPREGKFGHAAMFDVVVSHEKDYGSEEYVAPFSAMVCNFPSPTTKKVKGKNVISPSVLSLGEVETLFHEFGHLLHMTLSRARIESQSGANVAWDFVETPSQIMENWAWNKDVLRRISKHVETGESLPEDMIDRIVNGKKFLNAYFFSRQIIMGQLDLMLHTGKVKDATALYRKMHKSAFGVDLPEKETLFPAGFGHLVGYDAGYYSYLWALVYACDAFSAFTETGTKDVFTNKEVGMRWRKEVLEKGSSEDEMKLVKNFLGRSPNQKAFLKEVTGR